ncbi:MAG: hypothetical protein DHS20C16_03720 [Phycisphaerae bacterium]|nr:MAG: hypothetical protein DHS20C16_03720 [Phycisphaerae bacterium]
MHFVQELWVPILLAAVGVFVVSSVIHMLIPIHRNDYVKLPGEDAFMAQMRDIGMQPGEYVFPCPESMKEMGTPEMIEKYKLGPVGFLTIRPSGSMNMGVSLAQWFLYSLAISLVAAYLTRAALAPGSSYLSVFRFAGCVAFLGYGVSYVPNAIWKGSAWTTTAKFIFDGLLYGLVTGGVFGWLWPEASH